MVHLLWSAFKKPATATNEERVSSEDHLVPAILTAHIVTHVPSSVAGCAQTSHTQLTHLCVHATVCVYVEGKVRSNQSMLMHNGSYLELRMSVARVIEVQHYKGCYNLELDTFQSIKNNLMTQF